MIGGDGKEGRAAQRLRHLERTDANGNAARNLSRRNNLVRPPVGPSTNRPIPLGAFGVRS